MKTRIYIAALLAGMLALAGCGGGGSSDPGPSERMQMEMQALETATGNLETALKAAEDAGDDVTDEQITAITTAWNALKAELDKDNEADETTAQAAYDGAVARLSVVRANKRAGDASDALETARMGRETAQKGELTSADTALSTALSTALDADAEDVTEDMVTAITDARAALEAALRRAVDVSDEDKAQYQRNVEDSSLKLQTVQAKRDIAKAAEATREANERAGNAAKRADAASLKKALDNRSSNDDYQDIIADEDNKTATVVAALEGWQGAEYKKDKTEVRVYRKTQAGKMGDPINKVFSTSLIAATSTLSIGYSNFGRGELRQIDLKTVQPEWIKITGFTATAGIQQFPNTHGSGPENTVARIPGTFYGVSGTYYCTPAENNTCAVEVDGKNQKLGQVVTGPAGSENTNTLMELPIQADGPGWRFQPASLTARVTAGEDTTVAEYGWWLTKPATGDWMVNVFVDGGPGATALDTAELPSSGTAKYVGGAAGKFAFSSVIADRHEAGHFTAKVELNAKFDDNTISGTVNEFKGDADGMDKWSVALGTSKIGNYRNSDNEVENVDNGLIVGKFEDPAMGDQPDKDSRTTWTIDGTAEAEAGSWSGQLWNLTNGVPAVATGIFEAEYGSAATMIGAFGADKQ